MTRMKLVLMIGSLGIGFLSMASAGWAKVPAGTGPSCLVKNPGNGATALRATVAINSVIPAHMGENGTVDVLARVERGGALQFFRLHLVEPINGLSNEEVACRIFNPFDAPNGDQQARVQAFVNEILEYFGLQGRTIVITDASISKAEMNPAVDPTYYPPDGTDAGSMADITIYAQ
jgi:hypothetical protein